MARASGKSIVVGIVESLKDPEGLERVSVRLPAHENQILTHARVSTPFAGRQRGLFCKPDVGDEVLVGFEDGDLRRPYVLGSVWSKEHPPPATDGKPEQNNWRFLRSRSGHVLRFDDTAGGERIEIVDSDGARRVVIDASGAKIRIECDRGDVEIKAQGSVTVDATTVDLKASGNMTLKAAGQLTIKGSTVNIN